MTGLSSEFQLRDVFNERVINDFSIRIKEHYSDFKSDKFSNAICQELPKLSYGDRVKLITKNLGEFLPKDFEQAANILINSQDKEDAIPGKTNWDAFIVLPQCAYISLHGKNHFDLSMQALYEMTKRFSAENDLRTFLEVDYNKAMQLLHKWSSDPNHHVRRLVSEGIRPRLPLASRIKRFQENPEPVIELLEKLKEDRSEYVRRSVANNINDISKDHPKRVVQLIKEWQQSNSPETKWIINHASRTLFKAGNPDIMEIFGYNSNPKIITELNITNQEINIGDKLNFNLKVKSNSTQPQKLMIDYIVHFMKANGKTAPKVFKWTTKTLEPDQIIELQKNQIFKQATTRKLYPGIHKIDIQINGKVFKGKSFLINCR